MDGCSGSDGSVFHFGGAGSATIGNSTSSPIGTDMYSANAATGIGALCFASGTATSLACGGTTPKDFYNLGIKGNTTAGTYATTVINVAVNSGP